MSNYQIVKEWRKNNPEKVAAQARRYRAKHPDKVAVVKRRYRNNNLEKIREEERVAAATFRKNNPELQRLRSQRYQERQRKRKEEIAGRPRPENCELCQEPAKVVFDHCHAKGHFRGWICDRCNKVLGLVKDDILLLKLMIKYLKENKSE